MAIPAELECKIVQDLLVGYVAGEINPETRDWITRHLDQCRTCRSALAQYTDASAALPPAPPLSPDPGRKLLGRVRRSVWVVLAALLLSLGLTGGSLYWVFTAGRDLAGLPAEMPVPSPALSLRDVADRIPAPDGLMLAATGGSLDRAELQFENPDGSRALVELHKYPTSALARPAYDAWVRSFHSRMLSVAYDTADQRITKFRSGGQYYYAWQREGWFVTITVPGDAPEPVALRDRVRDHLAQVFGQLQ